jgi:hypothetical protein
MNGWRNAEGSKRPNRAPAAGGKLGAPMVTAAMVSPAMVSRGHTGREICTTARESDTAPSAKSPLPQRIPLPQSIPPPHSLARKPLTCGYAPQSDPARALRPRSPAPRRQGYRLGYPDPDPGSASLASGPRRSLRSKRNCQIRISFNLVPVDQPESQAQCQNLLGLEGPTGARRAPNTRRSRLVLNHSCVSPR